MSRGLGLSLFITLLVAKACCAPLAPATAWHGWLLSCADDAAVAVVFATLTWHAPRRLAGLLYGALSGYAALNVLIVGAAGTPLVWPMLRGIDSTMSDSAAGSLQAATLLPAVPVLLCALLAPRWLSRLAPGMRTVCLGLGVLLGIGMLLPRVVHPAQRNALVAFARSAMPIGHATPAGVAPAPPNSAIQRAASDELAALRGSARGRSVVLVVLESAAARFLAAYGAEPDAMPFVSSLAARGLLCTDANAVYPESIKGQIALLHSASPAPDTSTEQHGRVPTPGLPELLKPHGYVSGLFHAGRFRFLGMQDVLAASGFDVLADAATIGGERESSFGVDEESTVAATLAWVDTLPREQRFLATYMPVAGHHPYASPPGGPFDNRTMRGCAQNALHYADRAVGALWQGMCARRNADELLLCVVGDHGQAFGEHAGNFGHTFALYQENLAIPLVYSVPGIIESPLHHAQVTTHLDVAPTLIDLLGLPECAAHQGHSILRVRGTQAFAFTDWGEQLVAMRDGPWKLIHDRRTGNDLLFNLATDAGEQNDVAPSQPALCAAMRAAALGWIAGVWRTVGSW